MKILLRIIAMKKRAVIHGRKLQLREDNNLIKKIDTNHKTEIQNMEIRHNNDISEIRNQTRKHYEKIIEERNKEIKNLYNEARDKEKKFVEGANYLRAMTEAVEQAADFFNRANIKMKSALEHGNCTEILHAEMVKNAERGKDKIEYVKNSQRKVLPDLIDDIRK